MFRKIKTEQEKKYFCIFKNENTKWSSDFSNKIENNNVKTEKMELLLNLDLYYDNDLFSSLDHGYP